MLWQELDYLFRSQESLGPAGDGLAIGEGDERRHRRAHADGVRPVVSFRYRE